MPAAKKKKTPLSSRLITFAQLGPLKGIWYSRSSLARLEADGRFPKRVRLSGSRIGWYEHELDAWIAALERGPGDNHGKRKAAA